MSPKVQTIWLALAFDGSGGLQVFGAFTAKGLAEQRLRLAREQRAKADGWQIIPGASFFVEEVTVTDKLTDETMTTPIRLALNCGAFRSDGR